MTTKVKKSGRKVLLADVLDLNAATPLAAELLACRGGDVEVDASQTRRLGAQAVQILLSARRSWQEEGGRISIVNASPAFCEGLKLLGINEDELLDKETLQ